VPAACAAAGHPQGNGSPQAMSLKINELCVNCDVCEPVCPNKAISMGPEIYVIDPGLCTECVGHFDEPQCVAVCPVECIDPDPEHPETQEQLLAKLFQLRAQGVTE
jgi:ferredoxin